MARGKKFVSSIEFQGKVYESKAESYDRQYTHVVMSKLFAQDECYVAGFATSLEQAQKWYDRVVATVPDATILDAKTGVVVVR